MIELNNKKLCESCFCEIDGDICPGCGFSAAEYIADPLVLPMGTRLNDNIIVGRVMGKGGFGVTYLGYDLRMNKIIAVKEYYPNGIAYRSPAGTEVLVADTKSAETFDNGAEKFYAEAEMVAQFNGNPNIVSVYDYFRENNTVYLVMEYISGVTLKSYVKKHGRLTDGQALFVMDKIAAALSITHSAGVLHRDISPDNIMICMDGKVKLIDFGAARQIISESSSNLTVVMKPGYTPIEQYTKKGRQGAWTDIYALGVSVYYALTEVIIDDPYARMDDDSEFDKNRHGFNNDLWTILKKCTMINASERYGSAIDLRKALKSVSAPIKAEPIILDEDDLKMDSDSNSPVVPEDIALGKEVPLTASASVSKAPESIEIFEDSIAASPADDYTAVREAPDKKKKKKFLIGGLCAAVVIILGILVTGLIEKPLYVPLSTNYPGGGKADAVNTLNKNHLKHFTGDIKVVLDLETVNEDISDEGGYWHSLTVIDGLGNYVDIHAPNAGRDYWNSYGIAENQKTFTFIVKRADIDKAYNEFQFRVSNVIVKGAAVYNYDPDEYKINPEAKIIQLDSQYPGRYEYSSPIPKKELESFNGDVKVTLSIERFNDDAEDFTVNGKKTYWVSMLPHSGGKRVYTKADNIDPWEDFSFELRYVDVPDTFTFVISSSEISKLDNNEGLVFQCRNVIIKSAALEKA